MNARENEERKKQALRFFDYAENPIKDWIAQFLDRDPTQVFDKYEDQSDVISLTVEDKHYLVYLSQNPPNITTCKKRALDKEAMDALEKELNNPEAKVENIYKEVESLTAFVLPEKPKTNKGQNEYFKILTALSMMQDAIYNVYPFVAKSLYQLNTNNAEQKIDNPFDDVVPIFDPDDKTFVLAKINKYHYQKEYANHQIIECTKQLKKIADGVKDPRFDKANLPMLEENKNKILKIRADEIEKHNKITFDMINEQQVLCNEANKKLNHHRLYIVLEERNVEDNDLMMKRLPEIGDKYEDLEEESLIEKFKKQNNI